MYETENRKGWMSIDKEIIEYISVPLTWIDLKEWITYIMYLIHKYIRDLICPYIHEGSTLLT